MVCVLKLFSSGVVRTRCSCASVCGLRWLWHTLFFTLCFGPEAGIREINKQLNALCHAKRRAEQLVTRAGLTQRQVMVTLAVYILAGYDVLAAGQYAHGHSKLAARFSLQDIEQLVEDWFIGMSNADLTAMINPVSPEQLRLVRDAMRWLAGLRTVGWVADQNFRLGVAPSSDRMAAVHAQQAGVPVRASTSIWAVRFRKKWHLRFGKMGWRQSLPEGSCERRQGF